MKKRYVWLILVASFIVFSGYVFVSIHMYGEKRYKEGYYDASIKEMKQATKEAICQTRTKQ
jgi:hypothetical protein